MRPPRKQIGLAIVGCGTIGRIPAEFARDYPGIGWLGLCDTNAEVGQKLAEDAKADFFTTDYNELLKRSEVTAAIIATDENAHVGPVAGGVRAQARSVHRKAAGDRRQGFGAGAQGDRASRCRRRDGLHQPVPAAFPGGEGQARPRRNRRRDLRGHPRLHEPDGADRHYPQDQSAPEPDPDGGVGHARARHVAVPDGRQDAGVGLCPLDRQGARDVGHQGFDLRHLHHG